MNLKKNIFNNFLMGGFGKIVNVAATFVLIPLFARHWGNAMYGEWLMLTSIPAYFLAFPDIGIVGPVHNEIARLVVEKKYEEIKTLFSSSMLFLFLGGFCFFSLGAGVCAMVDLAQFFHFTKLSNGDSMIIVLLLLGQLLAAQFVTGFSCIYRVTYKNSRYNFVNSFFYVLQNALGVMALLLHVSCVQYAMLVFSVTILKLLFVYFDRFLIAEWLKFSLQDVDLKNLIPFIKPGLGALILPVTQALQNQGLILVIGFFAGASCVAIFQYSRAVVNGGIQLYNLFFAAIYPELTCWGKTKDGIKNGIRILIRTSQMLLLLTVAGCLVIFFFGEWLLKIWLGNNVEYMPLLIMLMMLSVFPWIIQKALEQLIASYNLLFSTVLHSVLAKIFGLLLAALCVRYLPFQWVGAAMIFMEFYMMMIFMSVCRKNHFFKFADFFRQLFKMDDFFLDIQFYCKKILKRA